MFLDFISVSSSANGIAGDRISDACARAISEAVKGNERILAFYLCILAYLASV